MSIIELKIQNVVKKLMLSTVHRMSALGATAQVCCTKGVDSF